MRLEAGLQACFGDITEAPDPLTGPLKPIEDATGAYVKVRS